MPTKHKREAVQLQPDVHGIVCKLAAQNDLSMSKTISLLVESALSHKGLYERRWYNNTRKVELPTWSAEQFWYR